MATQEKTRQQRRTEPEDADGPEIDHALQQQIADAVGPLINDLSEQISQTVRESFQLDGEQEEDQKPEPRRPEQRQATEQNAADAPDEQASTIEMEPQGTASMANNEQQRNGRSERNGDRKRRGRDTNRDGRRSDAATNRGGGRRDLAPRTQDAPQTRRLHPTEGFKSEGAIPATLLRLARSASDAGAVHTAIHAYTQIIERFPGTGASEAATEYLLELADQMQEAGRFYTALGILNRLEELYVSLYGDYVYM